MPSFPVYRTYPDLPIRFALDASDNEGGSLTYAASDLPSGAQLDIESGVFSWQPAIEQIGPFYVPVSVSDSGDPPLTASSLLTFQVLPPDPCRTLSCDPATGCTSALLPVDQACCPPTGAPRVPEPVAECPQGRTLLVGRNLVSGFGPLQDCDRFRVINFGQVGATVRFHVAARCLDTSAPLVLRARMTTTERAVFDSETVVVLTPRADGFGQRLSLAFPVAGPSPFFDLEAADANLEVTLRDAKNVEVSTQLRLVLTFSPIDDLPDPLSPPPPTPSATNGP